MTQRTTLAALRRSTALLAISLAFFACSDSNGDPDHGVIKGNSLLLNFTTNYETGVLRRMNPDATSLQAGEIEFYQDSKVFADGKNIFVLERMGADNLSCIQADKIGDLASIVQRALAPNSNPYEVTVVGNTGYIALNGLDYVQIFDVNTCALGTQINLPIEEAYASSIKAYGNELLVVAQRLEIVEGSPYPTATKPGLLIRINATTKAIIDMIPLNFYNPSSAVLSNGKLYVSSVDDYYLFENAGVEVVDLATGISEVLVTSAQLGGGVSNIALDESNKILYASVYISWGNAPVKPINLNNNAAIGSALLNITDAGEIVFDSENNRLFIADAGGLKAYDTGTKTTTPIGGDALAPYSLAIARW